MADPIEPATPAIGDNLSVALWYAENKHSGETPDQVVTRAKAYALFLAGGWQKLGVTSVAVTNGGLNYTTVPNVMFDPPGAEAVATLTNGVVTSVAVKNPGKYEAVPVVTFEGGGGTGATAVATLAD